MKAIQVKAFGPPSVMELVELPDVAPASGEVRVRIRAAGVNPVDTYVRSGTYAMKPALPYTPGGDGAGTIEAIGSDVVGLTRGQRVYVGGTVAGNIYGTYATHAICSAGQVHPLADHLSFEQGAAVNVAYVTAYRALVDRAGVRPGETVLVHGASGGVGIAAVQLASAMGCIVFGTAGSAQGRTLVTQQGAAMAFDHRESGYLDQIRNATRGRGPDAIIEMLANVNLDADLGLIAPGGRIVVVGNRGRVEIDPRQTMGKEATVTGVQMWAGGEAAVHRAHAHIVAGLARGTLEPVVGRSFPLDRAPEAHEAVMADGHHGKVVLIC